MYCSKAKKIILKFNRPHSFCVRTIGCVNYLITIQIKSCIKLECRVHTCLNCSEFDLCRCMKLCPADHLVWTSFCFSNILASSITEETFIVEIFILCWKIGTVNVITVIDPSTRKTKIVYKTLQLLEQLNICINFFAEFIFTIFLHLPKLPTIQYFV